jgi:hypothetical protein
MEAKQTNLLKVESRCVLDGETIIELNCRDYDHLVTLPQVIECEGMLLTQTGWNSDRCRAYYKSGGLYARPSTNKGR